MTQASQRLGHDDAVSSLVSYLEHVAEAMELGGCLCELQVATHLGHCYNVRIGICRVTLHSYAHALSVSSLLRALLIYCTCLQVCS